MSSIQSPGQRVKRTRNAVTALIRDHPSKLMPNNSNTNSESLSNDSDADSESAESIDSESDSGCKGGPGSQSELSNSISVNDNSTECMIKKHKNYLNRSKISSVTDSNDNYDDSYREYSRKEDTKIKKGQSQYGAVNDQITDNLKNSYKDSEDFLESSESDLENDALSIRDSLYNASEFNAQAKGIILAKNIKEGLHNSSSIQQNQTNQILTSDYSDDIINSSFQGMRDSSTAHSNLNKSDMISNLSESNPQANASAGRTNIGEGNINEDMTDQLGDDEQDFNEHDLTAAALATDGDIHDDDEDGDEIGTTSLTKNGTLNNSSSANSQLSFLDKLKEPKIMIGIMVMICVCIGICICACSGSQQSTQQQVQGPGGPGTPGVPGVPGQLGAPGQLGPPGSSPLMSNPKVPPNTPPSMGPGGPMGNGFGVPPQQQQPGFGPGGGAPQALPGQIGPNMIQGGGAGPGGGGGGPGGAQNMNLQGPGR